MSWGVPVVSCLFIRNAQDFLTEKTLPSFFGSPRVSTHRTSPLFCQKDLKEDAAGLLFDREKYNP